MLRSPLEVIVSLLGWRPNRTIRSAIWPLLVVAGLLTVPAECARIGHPHSLFQGAGAAPSSMPSHDDGVPHSATDHLHGESGNLPAWASPTADVAAPAERFPTAPEGHPAHPYSTRSAIPAEAPVPATAGDLPVVEPAAATAIAAFGTALALLASLSVPLLPGRPRATGVVAPLTGLLARALDPPPPRGQAAAC